MKTLVNIHPSLKAPHHLKLTALAKRAELGNIEPGSNAGARPTHNRLGGDQLLVDADGNSKISVQDFAQAMINEVEQPQHHNQRFTLAYQG